MEERMAGKSQYCSPHANQYRRTHLCGKTNTGNKPSGVRFGPILTFYQPLPSLLVERCARYGPIEIDMTVNVEFLV